MMIKKAVVFEWIIEADPKAGPKAACFRYLRSFHWNDRSVSAGPRRTDDEAFHALSAFGAALLSDSLYSDLRKALFATFSV